MHLLVNYCRLVTISLSKEPLSVLVICISTHSLNKHFTENHHLNHQLSALYDPVTSNYCET